LAACRLEGTRILSNLNREIGERGNYCQAADEVADVAECFENARSLPYNGLALQLQGPLTASGTATSAAARRLPRPGTAPHDPVGCKRLLDSAR
jgi:hypothetical protein